MGSLTLPPGGIVYVDTNVVIYSVEKIPEYFPLLRPLWAASASGTVRIASSELLWMETLVAPLRQQDQELVSVYERLLRTNEIELVPISAGVLRVAAELRASHRLKPPDAIHAASALTAGCSMLLTNDAAFRRIETLNVSILSELAA